MAKIFIFIGLIFILIGIILYVFKGFPLFRLPGDIVIDKGNFKFYFPITSSIIISIVLSVLFSIVSKFLK
ncbi:hypothetical protein NAMH_1750 [Nautilia profundicola AmH]|uniref:DUF2905 domain-containing protein n=1 Tax=Nautilia profundicola (strain ATCC BAA-1463 / DSM 18972 / AmH) TaxID=598659 RepID=B9L6Y7_NAUPA|nr:DUF2905 domain-containing protein [Nautilia profundicola]ACM93527.1 hypothetical protein NAMH_1750 [Nautilia profundicola AmH]